MDKDLLKKLKAYVEDRDATVFLESIEQTKKFDRIGNLLEALVEKRQESLKIEGVEMVKGEKGDKPVYGVDYLTLEEIQKIKEELLQMATPEKGVDYFTESDIQEFFLKVTPVKGVDYKDGEKGEDAKPEDVAKILKKDKTFIKSLKGEKGNPGESIRGEPGRDGIEILPKEIANKLNTLTHAIDHTVIRGLDELLKKKGTGPFKMNHGGGISNITGYITAGSNITITGLGTLTSPYSIASTGGGSGTVTSVSVTSTNGFAGTVANATTTPAITISTSITGLLQGNGTALSAVTVQNGLTYGSSVLKLGGVLTEDTNINGASGGFDFIASGEQLTISAIDTMFIKTPGVNGGSAVINTYLKLVNATTGEVEFDSVTAGISSLSAIGSSPNANGATITGTTLNLEPASASFGGVVTTGTQTFAGAKTFSSAPTFSTMTEGSVLFAGTGGLVSQDNTSFFWDNTNDILKIGGSTPTYTLGTNTLFTGTKSANTFITFNIQNLSNGTTASTDFIVNNDAATDTTNFLDIGISSSLNTDPLYTIAGAGQAYIWNTSEALAIGTAGAFPLKFFTGGTLAANEAGRITGTGIWQIGSTTPTQGRVNITALSTTAPAINIRGLSAMNGEVFNVENNSGTDQFQIFQNTNGTFLTFGTSINTPSITNPARIRSDSNAVTNFAYSNLTANTSAAASFSLRTSASTDGRFQLNSATNSTYGGGSSLNIINQNAASLTLATRDVVRQTIDADGNFTFAQAVQATGSPTFAKFNGAAHTTLTASTEAIDINFALNRTVQFSTGALTTQRAFVIQAPTYGFVGASTLTDAYTVAITAAPTAGTNATITRSWAFAVQAGNTQLAGSTYMGGTGVAPTARLHLAAGTATASTAPLKFTSGTNNTTAEAGAMEYNGTNLFFTRAGTTRENVLIAVDNVAAPTTTATPVFTAYYGGNTNALGDPNRWISVNILGTVYKIPLYT